MVLNPFYLIVTIYLASSIFSLVNGVMNGGFYLLSEFFPVSVTSYVYAFFSDVFFILMLIFYYSYIKGNKKEVYKNRVELGFYWGYFIITHQLLYILFVLQTGAGVAGSGYSFGGFNIFNYYFILLSPDMLTFIILPFLRSNRQFIMAVLILLVSMLLRGWLAGVLYFFFIALIRYYPVRLAGKKVTNVSFFSVLVISFLPILEGIKWGRRLGLSLYEIVTLSIDKFSFDIYVQILESTIARFSHLNYSALVFENSSALTVAYASTQFKSFWMNGILYETYCRLFDSCYIDLNTYLVLAYIDPGGKAWNVDTGFSAWFSILGVEIVIFVLFFILLLITFHYCVFRYLGIKAVNVFFIFTMFYFYNGWFSPYYNLLLYLLILSVVVRVKVF